MLFLKFSCKVSCVLIPTEFQVKIQFALKIGVLLAGGASAVKALFLLTREHQNDGRLQHPAGTQQGYGNLCTSLRVYICTEILVSKHDLYASIFFFSPTREGQGTRCLLCSVWCGACDREKEGMVGVRESNSLCEKRKKKQPPGGILGFVCISECFVCERRSLICLRDCVGGWGAAQKHLEPYRNLGISTGGERSAACRTHMNLRTRQPRPRRPLPLTPYQARGPTFTLQHLAVPPSPRLLRLNAPLKGDGLSGGEPDGERTELNADPD